MVRLTFKEIVDCDQTVAEAMIHPQIRRYHSMS